MAIDKDILAYQQWQSMQGGGGGLPQAYSKYVKPSAQGPKKRISSGIGSMVGGALGGVLGGAGGTLVAPGVGTVAGGVGGGALGSALGEAIDQILTGGRIRSGGQVAGEALLGSAPGVLGVGLKGIKAGKSGLKLADFLAQEAAEKTAKKVAGEGAKMGVRGKLNTYADNLLASQYGTISKPVARSTRLPETVNKLSKYGVTKPEDAERIAGQFTGGGGEVSKAVRAAIGKGGKIDASGVRKLAENLVIDQQIDPAKAKQLLKFLDVRIAKLGSGGADSAFDVIKRLESKAADLKGKGGTYHLPTSDDVALAKVHSQIADSLKDQVYRQANVKKVLTPDLRNKLVSLQPGNAKWQKFVDETVMKSKDVGSLRSTMAPFVKISQAIDEGSINSVTAGGRVGNLANGGGGLVSSVLNATVKSDIAKRTGAGLARGAAKAAPGEGVSALAGSGFAQGGVRAAASPLRGAGTRGLYADQEMAPDEPQDLTSTLMGLDGGGGFQAEDQSQNPFSPENIQAMAVRDIQETGGQNLDKIAKLQALFGQESAKQKPLSAEASKQVANANSGLRAISELEGLLGEDSDIYNKNDLAGVLGNFGRGAAGTQSFESARNEIIDVISRSRSGAALTKEEIAQYKKALPRLGDSPEEAQRKLLRFRTMFEDILGNQQAGSPDIESLI